MPFIDTLNRLRSAVTHPNVGPRHAGQLRKDLAELLRDYDRIDAVLRKTILVDDPDLGRVHASAAYHSLRGRMAVVRNELARSRVTIDGMNAKHWKVVNRVAELEALLRRVKAALEAANGESIVDTIWMGESCPETLFDFIDAALAGQRQGGLHFKSADELAEALGNVKGLHEMSVEFIAEDVFAAARQRQQDQGEPDYGDGPEFEGWEERSKSVTPAEGDRVLIPDGWEESLNLALVLETERAIKQRDKFLETGVVTASQGGSHDTCFAAIVRQHIAHLNRLPPELLKRITRPVRNESDQLNHYLAVDELHDILEGVKT